MPAPQLRDRTPSVETTPPRGNEPAWDLIELLFFAYRDFVGDADEALAEFDLAVPITGCCIS